MERALKTDSSAQTGRLPLASPMSQPGTITTATTESQARWRRPTADGLRLGNSPTDALNVLEIYRRMTGFWGNAADILVQGNAHRGEGRLDLQSLTVPLSSSSSVVTRASSRSASNSSLTLPVCS